MEFREYFTSIFTSDHPACPSNLLGLIQPNVSQAQNDILKASLDAMEIKRVLFSMENYESPGPDSMIVTFYKKYWDIVGMTVVAEVQKFFNLGHINPVHNHTFLALISKMQGVAKGEQFWSIVLCNVFFKIVTKILAGRLRPVLMDIIHPNQSAFIPQRSISDNIIINHEVMHYMNGKKGKSGFMAIKIDLPKAYDRVEWGTLNVIMRNMGFDEDFCNLIDNCISNATFFYLA